MSKSQQETNRNISLWEVHESVVVPSRGTAWRRWLAITGPAVSSIGFLGAVVTLEPGLWTVFIALAFGILALWATWGLWPGLFRKKRAKKSRKK